MPDSGIADGSSFTSAFWDDYVREQVVTTCTSGTRPSSVEGRHIYETDTDRVLFYNGTGWVILAEPLQTFTPSWTGVTVGNATNSGWYKRSDGWCEVAAKFTLGSTSAITGLPVITLPFTAGTGIVAPQFQGLFNDTGTSFYSVIASPASTTTVSLYSVLASGTYAAIATTSSTVPFTWVTGDIIEFSGRFPMSTRHT